MYLKNSVIWELVGLFLLVFGLPVISTTNKNCGGKAFHCVNATHFMICVDLGNGISTTVDDFVIPCPESTICSRLNRFECEFPQTTTLVHSLQLSDVTNDKQLENYIATNTPPWEEIDVATTLPTQNVRERSEKYLNSDSKPSQNIDVSTNAPETTIEDMLDVVDKNTYYVFGNSNLTKTSVPLELYVYETGKINETDNILTTKDKINSSATDAMVVKEATTVKEYTHGYKAYHEKDKWSDIDAVTDTILVDSSTTTENINNDVSTPDLVTFVSEEPESEMITTSIRVDHNQGQKVTENESLPQTFTENYLFPTSTSILEITDLNYARDLTIKKNIENNKLDNDLGLPSNKSNVNITDQTADVNVLKKESPRYVSSLKSIIPNENHTEMFLLPVSESNSENLLNIAAINSTQKMALSPADNVSRLSTESYASRKLIDSNSLTSNDFSTNVGNTNTQRANQDYGVTTSTNIPQRDSYDVDKVLELYPVTISTFLNTHKNYNLHETKSTSNKNEGETKVTTLPTTDPTVTGVYTLPVLIYNEYKNVPNDINYLEAKNTENTDIYSTMMNKPSYNSYDILQKNEDTNTWETSTPTNNLKYTTHSSLLQRTLETLEPVLKQSLASISEKPSITTFEGILDKTPNFDYTTYNQNEATAFPNITSVVVTVTENDKNTPPVMVVETNKVPSAIEIILEPTKYAVPRINDKFNYITDTTTTSKIENTKTNKNVYYTWPSKKMLSLGDVKYINNLSVKNQLLDKEGPKKSTEETTKTFSADLMVSTKTKNSDEYYTKEINTNTIAKVISTTEHTQLLKSTDSENLRKDYDFISIAPTTQKSESSVTNTKYDIWLVDHIFPISQDAKKYERYSAPILTTFEQPKRKSMSEITPKSMVTIHDENETYNAEVTISTINGNKSNDMLVNVYNSVKSPDNVPILSFSPINKGNQKIDNADKYQHDVTSSTINNLNNLHNENIMSKSNPSLFSQTPTELIPDNRLLQQTYFSTITENTYSEITSNTQRNNINSTNHNYFSFWPTRSSINITLDTLKIKSQNNIKVVTNRTAATSETDNKKIPDIADNANHIGTVTTTTQNTFFEANNLIESSTHKEDILLTDNNALFIPRSTQKIRHKVLGTNTNGFERVTLPIKNEILSQYELTKRYKTSEDNFELLSPYVNTIMQSNDKKSIYQMLLTTITPSYATMAKNVPVGYSEKLGNLRIAKPLEQLDVSVTIPQGDITQTGSTNSEKFKPNIRIKYDQMLLTSMTTPYEAMITKTDDYKKENQNSLKLDEPTQQLNKILGVQGDSTKTESSKLENIKGSTIDKDNDHIYLLASMTKPYETLVTTNREYIEKNNWESPTNIETLENPLEFMAVIPNDESLTSKNQDKKEKLIINPTKALTNSFEEFKLKETQLKSITTIYQNLIINDDPTETTMGFDLDKNIQSAIDMELSVTPPNEDDPMIKINQSPNLYKKNVSINLTMPNILSENDSKYIGDKSKLQQKYVLFTTYPDDFATANKIYVKGDEKSTSTHNIWHSIHVIKSARLTNSPNLETQKHAALNPIDLQSNANDILNTESSIDKQFNVELPNISVRNEKTSKTDSWNNKDVKLYLKQIERDSTPKFYNSTTTEMTHNKIHAAKILASKDDSFGINYDVPFLSRRYDKNYDNDIRILPTIWSFQDENETSAVAKHSEFLNDSKTIGFESMTDPPLVLAAPLLRKSESYSRKPLIMSTTDPNPRKDTTQEYKKFGQKVDGNEATSATSFSSGSYINTWQDITKLSGAEKNPDTLFKVMNQLQIRVITNREFSTPHSENIILSNSSSKKAENVEVQNREISKSYADHNKLQPNIARTAADFYMRQNEKTQTGTLQPLFTCINRHRGRYSDANDCKKFYICMGRTDPIIGFCPNNTVFSEIKKQCTKNLSHCIRNNQFRCASEGRFYDFFKKNIYYICVKNKIDIFVRFQFQCQNGFYLNKKLVKCVIDTRMLNKARSNSETGLERNSSDSSISKYANLSESGENNFPCRRNGIFADPSDSRAYYICCRIKGRLRRKKKRCESDQIYDSVRKRCEDMDSSENGS